MQLERSLAIDGLTGLHLPGIALSAVNPPVTAADTVAQADWWIFTSPAAIQYALRWFHSFGLTPQHYPDIAVLSEKSAQRLYATTEQQPLRIIWPGTGHRSEDLLIHPRLQSVSGRQIVIFNAPEGRRLLTDSLRQQGATVQEVNIYRRVPAELDNQRLQRLSEWQDSIMTLWTSNTAIEHLHSQLPQPLWQKLMQGDQLLLSERQKSALKSQCTGNMYLADAPDNASLRKQIIGLYV